MYYTTSICITFLISFHLDVSRCSVNSKSESGNFLKVWHDAEQPSTVVLCGMCLFYAGIPTLVILDKEGKVVTSSGRAAVSSDPDGLVRVFHI